MLRLKRIWQKNEEQMRKRLSVKLWRGEMNGIGRGWMPVTCHPEKAAMRLYSEMT